jgi:predicted metalloprotease with PDZ domain
MKKAFVFLTVCLALNIVSPVPAKADGLSLEYDLTIDDPATGIVHVVAHVTNIAQDSLTFVLQYPGGDLNAYVLYYEFTGADGASLPFDVRTEGGEVPKVYWDVDVTGRSSITFTYDVLKQVVHDSGHGYHDYLGYEWGTFDNSSLFAEPRNDSTPAEIEQISVFYQLPDNWTVVTPWPFDGQRYWPASWWELYANVTAVGPIDVNTLSIGGELQARIGIHQDLLKGINKAKLLADMQTLLTFYYTEFGLDNPIIAFTWIRPIPAFDQDNGESAHLLYNMDKTFWGGASNGLWESWQRGSGTPDLWAFESFSRFYGFYAPYRIGWLPEAEFFRRLGQAYATYQSDRAEGRDAPLSERPEQIDKGLLVVYMLDQEVRTLTGNASDINDVHRHLVEHATSHQGWNWNRQRLEEALLAVTGQDFGPFFTDYADGTTEITLPDLADDDDDDAVNCVEAAFGTVSSNPDTDGDGLTDGDEVYLTQSDPILADTDGDGVGDSADSYPCDRDNDGLNDERETLFGTNPDDPDSDDDGVLDGD